MEKLFSKILSKNLETGQFEWLNSKYQEIKKAENPTRFYMAFGMVSREISSSPLSLTHEEQKELNNYYPGFNPDFWNVDQFCRVYLTNAINSKYRQKWLTQLFSSADVSEQVALYKGLFFLENAREFTHQVTEGIRTNIIPVFDAIALNNPFPNKFLDDNAWNQMVLKALFMERPIYRIEGLDERKNKKLSETLVDYIHERWSAGRDVAPELWRLMTNHLDGRLFDEIVQKFEGLDSLRQEAILRLAMESNLSEAQQWVESTGIKVNHSWNELGYELEQKTNK